ncbi:hypothetical protein ACGFI5_04090 [Micromonospora tulbaghiae]|uniref:hypothetical protein n=1 Tax=Micromonospora tulbaghiae TaxID=479978 RepID=UPI00371319ED
MTPLWVPLAVAVIGVLGTLSGGIAGVLITQRRSDRREDKTWERERARERERWSREDEARTFDHRRESYVDFYDSLKTMARLAYDKGYGFLEEPELPDDWHMPAFERLNRLKIYAAPPVAAAAAAAYNAAWQWGHYCKHDDPDDPKFHEWQVAYDHAEIDLLMRIRGDLAIPGSGTDDVAALI